MSLISYLFGADELQATGDKYDALNQADATARYQPGGPTYEKIKAQKGKAAADAAWEQVQKNYQTGATGNVSEQIDAAFDEGWEDGKKNVTGFVSSAFKVVRDVLSSVLLGIPFWIWAAAVFVLWGYLGFPGLKALKKKLA